jgi:hypothetical protein
MSTENLPVIRVMRWVDTLPEFTEPAANEYYRPKVDFGLFTSN